MIISSTSENKEIEKRIAVTPEITKKYINLGFQIQLIKNYGKHIGFEGRLSCDHTFYVLWDRSMMGKFKVVSAAVILLTCSGVGLG